VYSAKN